MTGLSGRCRIDQIDLNAHTKNGKPCVRILLWDPNNKSQWYRGDLLTFYGDDNRELLQQYKVGDYIGVQTDVNLSRDGWNVFFHAYRLKG